LGPLDGTLLVVGSDLQSPGLLVGLWVVGGLLTLAGALSYGELAAALPRAGVAGRVAGRTRATYASREVAGPTRG
jgi:amino acid transporter